MDEEEATEKGVISVTPVSNKLKGTARRNSTGKTNTRDPPSLSNSDEKLLPHYLRASTGSCHDFCKFGRKHVFEAKRRRPYLPTFLGSNVTLDEDPNQPKPPVLRQRRKKLDLKLKQLKTEIFNDQLKTIKQKGLSSAIGTPSTRAERLSEELSSIASADHAPANWAEGSSEEPVVIKLMNSSSNIASSEHAEANRAEGSEELITTNLDTLSPTQKSIVSDEHTPATWVEGSSEEPVRMKLMTSSCIQKVIDSDEHSPASLAEGSYVGPVSIELMTPSPGRESIKSAEYISTNQAEGSSKKPISLKLKTPSSIPKTFASTEHMSIVRAKGSSGLSKIKKTKNSSPVHKNTVFAKRTPAHLAEKSSKESTNVKLKTPSFLQKSIASAEHTAANRAELSEEPNQIKGLRTKPKITQRSKTEIPDRPKIIKQKEIDASAKPYIIKYKTPSPVKKTITSIIKKVVEETNSSSVEKTVASVVPKTIKQKASSPSKRIYVSAKPAISLKPRTSVVTSLFPSISSGGRTTQRKQVNRIIRSADRSETGEKKLLKPPKASPSAEPPVNGTSSMKLRKFRNAKPASPVKYQTKVGKWGHDTEIVKEKILHVIEPKQENINLKPIKQKSRNYRSSFSSQYLPSSSLSPVSSHEKYKHDDSDSAFSEASVSNLKNGRKTGKNPVDTSKGDSMRRQRKTAAIRPEDKLPSPHKLKFRRGMVVNFQPEINAPRKLKFRQARVGSEKQNSKGEVGKRSFRKREVNVEDSNPPSLEAPAVVLRHQGVQDRRDTQGLFNLVIEETASKLVEARKSKVKALVGAFETVISLQESK